MTVLRLGIAFGVATLLLDVLLTSALPTVLDLRPIVVVTGGLAGVVLLTVRRRARSRVGAAFVIGLIAEALGNAAYAAYDLTLAYRTEEVSFTNGDVTLYGTLYLPRGTGQHPAAVLLQGSGTQPRGEYRFYARTYARRGIAALAYDKRGSGLSTGSVRTSTYQDFAADAVEAIRLLRRHPAIDSTRVGIWALSEGEWVGAAAADIARPKFLVLISASAMTPTDQVRYETESNVRRAGFSDAAAREAGDLYARLSQFQRTGQGREELNRRLAAVQPQPWFSAAFYLETSVPDYSEVVKLSWFSAWRARMDFDALPILARLTCPVLAQVGGADPKMDGAASLDRIRRALVTGSNAQFTGVLYPRAEHSVVEWRLPFRIPPPWFASGYLKTQVEWVRSQVQ